MGHHEAIALHRQLEMPAVPSPTNMPVKWSEAADFELSMNADHELQEEDFNIFAFENKQEFWEQGFKNETEFDNHDFVSEIQKLQY